MSYIAVVFLVQTSECRNVRDRAETVRHPLSPYSSADFRRYVPIDVPAQFSFVEYAAGRDPAVDATLPVQRRARST